MRVAPGVARLQEAGSYSLTISLENLAADRAVFAMSPAVRAYVQDLFTNYFNHVAATELDFPAAPDLAA